jgi:deoxyribodipyrimidine photo-lyase
MPKNLKFDFVHWEVDEERWKKWTEQKTGVPLVDVEMRQLNHQAYMHSRLRVNVSPYL